MISSLCLSLRASHNLAFKGLLSLFFVLLNMLGKCSFILLLINSPHVWPMHPTHALMYMYVPFANFLPFSAFWASFFQHFVPYVWCHVSHAPRPWGNIYESKSVDTRCQNLLWHQIISIYLIWSNGSNLFDILLFLQKFKNKFSNT
jgi:hypothetical protein